MQMASASTLSATAINLTVNAPSNPLKPGRQQVDVSVDRRDIRLRT